MVKANFFNLNHNGRLCHHASMQDKLSFPWPEQGEPLVVECKVAEFRVQTKFLGLATEIL